MPRILTFGNYGVYVFAERGQPHHLPHCHIKQRGQRVASAFIVTLELFDATERLPPGLMHYIREHQQELFDAWEDLNRE